MNTKRYLACVSANQSLGEQIHREVAETLTGMQTIAMGLPFLPLTEGYQWKLHQLALADADFNVILIGADYGPLSATGVGYLHRAYAFANASKKPLLVLHGAGLGTSGDTVDQRRLDGFLSEIAKQRAVVPVRNTAEVRERIEHFVDELLEGGVIKGWCPAEQWGADEAVQKDLLAQINTLHQRLEQQRIGAGSVSARQEPAPEIRYRVKVFRDGNLTSYDHALLLDWNRIFSMVAPLLTEPQRESDWKGLFEERLLRMALPDLRQQHPQAHGFVELRLDGVVFDHIKMYLRRCGWLFQSQGVWQLSALGEDAWLRNS